MCKRGRVTCGAWSKLSIKGDCMDNDLYGNGHNYFLIKHIAGVETANVERVYIMKRKQHHMLSI